MIHKWKMMQKNQDQESRRSSGSRMSIDGISHLSSMSFASLAKDNVMHGEELIDVFQNTPDVPMSSHTAGWMPSMPSMQIPRTISERVPSSGTPQAFGNESNPDLCVPSKPPVEVIRASNNRRGSVISQLGDSELFELEKESSAAFQLPDIEKSLRLSDPDPNSKRVSNTSSHALSSKRSSNTSSHGTGKHISVLTEILKDKKKSGSKISSTTKVDVKKEPDEDPKFIKDLNSYDIICGRHNGAYNWIGNRRFRITIMMFLKRFNEAKGKEEKAQIITSVIDLLLNDVGARFVRKCDDGLYVRLESRQIREKVGHAFRNMTALSKKIEQENREQEQT